MLPIMIIDRQLKDEQPPAHLLIRGLVLPRVALEPRVSPANRKAVAEASSDTAHTRNGSSLKLGSNPQTRRLVRAATAKMMMKRTIRFAIIETSCKHVFQRTIKPLTFPICAITMCTSSMKQMILALPGYYASRIPATKTGDANRPVPAAPLGRSGASGSTHPAARLRPRRRRSPASPARWTAG